MRFASLQDMEGIPEPPQAPKDSHPAIIIGHGRLGEAIRRMGIGRDTIVKRGDPFPRDAPPGPIYVCTGNGSLKDVIAMTPEDRWEDFVFLQRGALLPFLERELRPGLPITVLLAYFFVAARGRPPTSGCSDMDPHGLTAVNHNGKWAQEASWRLSTSDISIEVLYEPSFTQAYCERNLWTAAYMLVGSLHGCTVGEVESQHREEVDRVAGELATAITGFYPDVRWDRGLVCERLASYARSVADMPAVIEDFDWHNGAFHELSSTAQAAGRLDPCPLHTEGLRRLGMLPAASGSSGPMGSRGRGQRDVKNFLLDI